MIDISNFCNLEILPRTVDSKLVVNLKPPHKTGVRRSNTNNTNITVRPISFNKFRPSKNGKTDSKITESMQIEHNKMFGSI